MKNKTILLLFALLLCSCDETFSYEVKEDFSYSNSDVQIVDNLDSVYNQKAHIVFLYGQSNADGVSSNAYLEQKDFQTYQNYSQGYANVLINYVNDGGNTSSNGAFQKCTLGCGCSPDYFGPEMGIAEKMSFAHQQEKTFIIKWTWGGTRIRDQWLDNHHNRGDLYNSSMDFSLKCLTYLSNKGYDILIDGICWMQGESDAYNNDWRAYYRDTVSFVTLLRYDLASYKKDIKFVDAMINDDFGLWPYPKAINDAKEKFANLSNLNYCIDTNAIGLSTRTEPEENADYAHYDSLSMVKLGQEFGEIVAK